jgi:tetratricopeptide (TPR) repeat protein
MDKLKQLLQSSKKTKDDDPEQESPSQSQTSTQPTNQPPQTPIDQQSQQLQPPSNQPPPTSPASPIPPSPTPPPQGMVQPDQTQDASEEPDVSIIMKDAPFPHRPEHDIYFIALQQVWEDNIITDDEKRMLDGLQASLGISKDEHNFLESKIAKDESQFHLATYRKILEQAWADGILTADEQALLSKMRNKLHITEEEHVNLENEIKSNLPEGIEQAVVVNEDDPTYWVRKGEELWSASNGSEEDALKAISYFDKAIQLEPLNYFAWANKGLILKKLDKREEAILCYDRAIQIQPSYPNSWFNKGVLLGCLGQLEEAVKCFDKVLEIAPNHKLAIRDRQMLIDIINKKQSSRVKTRALKIKI